MKRTVLIVGAGVIGCSLAHELTRRGASVVVLDAAEAGSGTSAASFAWVNASNKSPLDYYTLNMLGIAAHERAAHRLAGARWFHQTGNLEIAKDDTEHHALARKVTRLAADGYPATLIGRDEVRRLEPGLDPAVPAAGAWYPKEGWIDTATMCSELLHRAVAAGAVFVPYARVSGLTPTGLTAVTADGATRRYDADVTVLTAGNGIRPILATAGITFPTLDPDTHDPANTNPTVGLVSTTGPVRADISHIVRTPGIAMRPARNGGIVFTDHPTGGRWSLDDPRIWSIPSLLLERARTLYPALAGVLTRTVTLGTRVLPEDGLTITDWVDAHHNTYAIATHSGVTLAAHLADTVAEEVLTGHRHESLRPFGLARFAAA